MIMSVQEAETLIVHEFVDNESDKSKISKIGLLKFEFCQFEKLTTYMVIKNHI